MLTLVDKAMLVKYYYLSEELAVEALQMFQTEKKMKKRSGPVTLARLIPLIRRFEETRICRINLTVVCHDCQKFVSRV